MLDLSQVDSGRMALSRDWVEMPSILDEAMLAVQALFETKGLELTADMSPSLPLVFCDATRIRQVILNLLSNAGRFTVSGSVNLRVSQQDRNLIISVADSGPGIPSAARDRIFEPFQQLDGSISRRHGGSGLGLAISRELVELHGGRMWLESEVDVGTTFFFSLPLVQPIGPHAADGAGAATDARRWFSPYSRWEFRARTRRSMAPVSPAIPRIVLLEDGDGLGRLLERYLRDVDVEPVRSLEAAYRELRRSPAQALIVNRSPATKGSLAIVGANAHLDNLPFGTPAIGCWVPGKDDAARQLGVVAYLVKPISSETLLSAIEGLGTDVRDVLVVDDEPEALQLFTRQLALSPRDYRVIQAMDGRRALELLRERRPDAVLLDLVMPGMSGFDLLRARSEEPEIRDIPVIAISALDPQGEAMMSTALTVTRGGGLSVRDLLECIQAISEILAPPGPTPSRESAETSAG